MLEAIVAVNADWGIGAEGTQSVVLRADRRRFRALTLGAAVIAGRRTLADFPGGKPLPGRVNLILTRRSPEIEGAVTVRSVSEALRRASDYPRVFVIGGASVYRALFPYLRRVHVTRLDCAPESDVFFPDLDADSAWHVADAAPPQTENGVGYQFLVYEKEDTAHV